MADLLLANLPKRTHRKYIFSRHDLTFPEDILQVSHFASQPFRRVFTSPLCGVLVSFLDLSNVDSSSRALSVQEANTTQGSLRSSSRRVHEGQTSGACDFGVRTLDRIGKIDGEEYLSSTLNTCFGLAPVQMGLSNPHCMLNEYALVTSVSLVTMRTC